MGIRPQAPGPPAFTFAVRLEHPEKSAEPTTMAEIKSLNPDTLAKPGGQYSHVMRVRASEFLFIAGQVATDRAGNFVGPDDIEAQCAQVYANIGAALEAAGAGWKNVVQFTTYVVHSQDIPKLRN